MFPGRDETDSSAPIACVSFDKHENMQSIVLLTGNHLCHNPRVVKEASLLARAGYEVEVLGGWFDPILKERDRELQGRVPFTFSPAIDLTGSSNAAKLRRLRSRLVAKAGGMLFKALGVSNRAQLGYGAVSLSRVARCRSAALFIAHSEAGLLVANDLLGSGYRVGIDMEDWFSEDLLPEARKGRPVAWLRKLERRMLRQGAYATCTSHSMSVALVREYGCRAPSVVYNAFPLSDRDYLDGLIKDRAENRRVSIHWFSQTIGPGRGLEDLLVSLSGLKYEAEVHLRGNPVEGFEKWLGERVSENWRSRIFLHTPVSNEELLSRIAEHDIGFAGEMKYAKSRDLTITNKILHYLLAGLAVVASDTSGQQEVASQSAGAVLLYPAGQPLILARNLNNLIGSPEKLRIAKVAALRAAEQTFCWERQEETLLGSVQRALGVSRIPND